VALIVRAGKSRIQPRGFIPLQVTTVNIAEKKWGVQLLTQNVNRFHKLSQITPLYNVHELHAPLHPNKFK
jgi:hypothetical protein